MIEGNQLVHFRGPIAWREWQDHNVNVDAGSMVSQSGFAVPEASFSVVPVCKPLPGEVILSHTVGMALHELVGEDETVIEMSLVNFWTLSGYGGSKITTSPYELFWWWIASRSACGCLRQSSSSPLLPPHPEAMPAVGSCSRWYARGRRVGRRDARRQVRERLDELLVKSPHQRRSHALPEPRAGPIGLCSPI